MDLSFLDTQRLHEMVSAHGWAPRDAGKQAIDSYYSLPKLRHSWPLVHAAARCARKDACLRIHMLPDHYGIELYAQDSHVQPLRFLGYITLPKPLCDAFPQCNTPKRCALLECWLNLQDPAKALQLAAQWMGPPPQLPQKVLVHDERGSMYAVPTITHYLAALRACLKDHPLPCIYGLNHPPDGPELEQTSIDQLPPKIREAAQEQAEQARKAQECWATEANEELSRQRGLEGNNFLLLSLARGLLDPHLETLSTVEPAADGCQPPFPEFSSIIDLLNLKPSAQQGATVAHFEGQVDLSPVQISGVLGKKFSHVENEGRHIWQSRRTGEEAARLENGVFHWFQPLPPI